MSNNFKIWIICGSVSIIYLSPFLYSFLPYSLPHFLPACLPVCLLSLFLLFGPISWCTYNILLI